MPKGGYREGGSGNAAWRASRAQTQGSAGRQRCTRIKRDGTQCKGYAIRNWNRCFMHGGAAVLAKRGLYRRKLRHGSWTEAAPQSGS